MPSLAPASHEKQHVLQGGFAPALCSTAYVVTNWADKYAFDQHSGTLSRKILIQLSYLTLVFSVQHHGLQTKWNTLYTHAIICFHRMPKPRQV